MSEASSQKTSRKVIASRLGKRFAILIVLFSSCFTLLSTSLQLILDYRVDISRIEQQFTNIRTSYLQAITLSVWSLDDSQIETQLVGLSQLPDIEHVSIKVSGETNWQQGDDVSTNTRTMEFPLSYRAQGISEQNIGTLVVTASIDNVYKRLINKAGVILVSNAVKTFLVSGFILLLIWVLITRHLHTISEYISTLDFDNLRTPLQLQKKENPNKPDEIDSVAHTINHMRESLHSSYEELNEHKQHLQSLVKERDNLLQVERNYKEHLEDLVSERTDQLEKSMDDLRSAQDMLIESEKMAALGNMVAGVAHEINTPIGVCRTAASYQDEGSKLIRKKLEQGTLTQSDLKTFLDDIDESSLLFETNIVKASRLISSFKEIAMDQSYDAKHKFNLKNYLESSIQTIFPQYKHQNVTFSLDIPDNIEMNSYPGALHQVLSNLINNSVLHGFEDNEIGEITIRAERDNEQLALYYSDNGRGLNDEEQKKLFEPFFTTRRGNGGSGLGMSIVFNIVSRQLEGRIALIPSNESGFHIKITIPLEAKDKPIEL